LKIILNHKKTGFYNKNSNNEPVVITDLSGKIFYTDKWLNKPVKRFNLPKGKYLLKSGDIIRKNNPVSYRSKKLPPFERYIKQKRFKIKFAPNPNKATVYHNEGLIVFDPVYKNCPKFIYDFILFHEFGHQYYKTEKHADTYARNKMLKRGYNPSQIAIAPLVGLSESSPDFNSQVFERKEKIVNSFL
jgi:hypothetical protein